MSRDLAEPTEGVLGYAVEIAMELHRGEPAEVQDEQYERIRAALVRYEDAVDPPLRVVLTRRAPLPLDAGELSEAMAVCREAMVDVLGVAADHAGVSWELRQCDGPPALLVELTALRDP